MASSGSTARPLTLLRLYQPMPPEGKPAFLQLAPPAIPRPDPGSVIEQSVLLFLGSQACELLPPPVLGGQERLLPVQHRRVRTLGVVVALNLPRPQVQLHTAKQWRVASRHCQT